MFSVITTLAIWIGNKWFYGDWFADNFKYVAKIASLTSTILIIWTILLSIRNKWLENLFGGLDKVYQAHKYLGISSALLILLHPLFLSLNKLPDLFGWLSFLGWRLPYNGNYQLGHNFGILALLGMYLLLGLTMYLKLPYDFWKRTHEYFGLVYILIFAHIVLVDADIAAYPLLRIWMYGWMGAGLLAYLYIRFGYYLLGPKYRYIISDLELVEDIVEITLQPVDSKKKLNFLPSQFAYLKFHSSKVKPEYHPYSIACAPNSEDKLKFGIKRYGDHTKTLVNLQMGDRVTVMGAYGKFSDKFLLGGKDCVFIGGGIGVTPFLGMWDMALNSDELDTLEVLEENGEVSRCFSENWKSPRIKFFYLAKTRAEASFHNDIKHLAIVSQYNGHKPYEMRGHYYEMYLNENHSKYFDVEYLKEKVGPDLSRFNFFLCGPSVLTKSLIRQLKDSGVKNSQIVMESFDLVG